MLSTLHLVFTKHAGFRLPLPTVKTIPYLPPPLRGREFSFSTRRPLTQCHTIGRTYPPVESCTRWSSICFFSTLPASALIIFFLIHHQKLITLSPVPSRPTIQYLSTGPSFASFNHPHCHMSIRIITMYFSIHGVLRS